MYKKRCLYFCVVVSIAFNNANVEKKRTNKHLSLKHVFGDSNFNDAVSRLFCP